MVAVSLANFIRNKTYGFPIHSVSVFNIKALRLIKIFIKHDLMYLNF